MPIINLIPESVVVDILSGWCDLCEIVKFDSAVCGNKQRACLQRLYSRKFFSVSAKLKNNKLSNLAWCCLKGLSVSRIEVTRRDQLEYMGNISTIYPAFSTSIKYITCDSAYLTTRIDPLVDFINACSELSGIALGISVSAAHLMNVNVDIMAKLTTFVMKSYDQNHGFIAYMAQHCKQLTSFKSYGFGAENESVLIDIIEKNEKLRDIYIHEQSLILSHVILDTLTTRLDCLSSVYLCNCSKIPYRSLVKFIVVASKTLKSLELTAGFVCNRQGFTYFLGRDCDPDSVESSVNIGLMETCNGIHCTADLLYIFEHLTTLDHITLDWMEGRDGILTDDVLYLIAKTNSTVSRVNICGYGSKYNEDMLKEIFKDCPQKIRFSNVLW